MSKKFGFTLFEMLVVVMIVGILASMTFGIGMDRIRELDRQSVKEQFVDNFNNFVSQSRISSSFNGQKYSVMTISLLSGAQGFQIALSGTTVPKFTGFSLSSILINRLGIVSSSKTQGSSYEKLFSNVSVVLKPYEIGCHIFANNELYSSIQIESTIVDTKTCFRLDSSLCSLKKVPCL